MSVPQPAPGANGEGATPNDFGVPSDCVEDGGTFASLRIRDFRFLLTGTTLSNLAQWIQQVTLGWLVYDMTGSGTLLGSVNLVRSVPAVGAAPLVGVVMDRVGRRTLMWITNGWLFLITFGIGLLLVLGHAEVWFLFAFSFLAGLAQTFNMTLRQTIVFDMVPRVVAPNAVALMQTGWALMRSLGPAVGGFLILWLGAGGNFLVQAGTYVLIAFTILWIHFPPLEAQGRRSAAFENVREGIRFVIKEPVTRAFMMMGWVMPFFIIPIFVALPPIYAKDVFHGGPQTLGFLLSAVGVGGIVGGLFTASLGRLERRGVVQLASLLLLSLSLTGFAFSSSLMVALPFLALAGFFEMVYLTTNQILLQLSIPNEMRGRVTSLVNLNPALSPIGSFFAGVGSDMLGGPRYITIAFCGIAAVIAVVVFLTSPTIRDYRLSRAIPPGSSGPV